MLLRISLLIFSCCIWESDTRNVLLIIADDAGFETEVYNNSVVHTPHLRALAQRGLVFSNAFTSVSSCSPSRSAILTGLPQALLERSTWVLGLCILSTLPTRRRTAQSSRWGGTSPALNFWSANSSKLIKRIEPTDKRRSRFSCTWPSTTPIDVDTPSPSMERSVRSLEMATWAWEESQTGNQCITPQNKSRFLRLCQTHPPRELTWRPSTPRSAGWTRVCVSAWSQEELGPALTRAASSAGVGLVLRELRDAGYENDTLVIYSSDNGIPFPNGRTNLYRSGVAEPMIVSSPEHRERWRETSQAYVTLLDITPTILDWFSLPYPSYSLPGSPSSPVRLTGRSLLPVLSAEPGNWQTVFASQSLHEVTMYYPTRSVHRGAYHLLHNLHYRMAFPVDQDLYVAPTFQDLLNRSRSGEPTHWFKSLGRYYYRERWELYDARADPLETVNLASDPAYSGVLENLRQSLQKWQWETGDPWVCGPDYVLEDKLEPRCRPLYNGL